MVDLHYSVKEPHFDDGFAIGDGLLRMTQAGSDEYPYSVGEFTEKRGTVTVYRQNDLTRLNFAHGERVHMRTWECCFRDRTIARIARAFISDVLAKHTPTPERRNV